MVAPTPFVNPVSMSGGKPSLIQMMRVPVDRLSLMLRLSHSTSALPSPLKSPTYIAYPTGGDPPCGAKLEPTLKVPSPLPSQRTHWHVESPLASVELQRTSAMQSPLKSATVVKYPDSAGPFNPPGLLLTTNVPSPALIQRTWVPVDRPFASGLSQRMSTLPSPL